MFKNRQFLRVLVLITVLIIGYVFSIGKDAIQIDRQGDAAIFEQVSENIYAGKGAISNVFAATQNYIDRQYFSYSLSELLAKKLEPPISKERNMTHFHAYWVLYLFAPLLAWFHSSLLLTASQVLVYLGLVYGAFYILEKECNRFPIALLFGILILISPAIAGGIAGQFYPDRLFVFLGFLLCYLVYYKANIIIIVLLSLLTALINERAALIGGLTIIFVPLCQRDSLIFIKRNVAVFVVGLVLIAYSYWVGKFWLSNLYYSTYLPKNLTELTARFSDPVFFHNAVIFVLSNAVLLAFSMGNYRLFFLSVFFMIPNFIGNIGGAEKVNWLTHYHSYYIPVLVFSAAEGAAVIGNKLSFGKNLGFITIAFFLTCGLLSHESDSGHVATMSYISNTIQAFYDRSTGRPTGYELRRKVISMVPEGSFVVTDEQGMAILKNHVRLDRFPVSVSSADFILLPCSMIAADNINSGSTLVPNSWMRDKGFDSHINKEIRELGLCLYPRVLKK